LNPADVKMMCGNIHPVIVDGRNMIDPDAFVSAGFVYKGIGRGDRNNHQV